VVVPFTTEDKDNGLLLLKNSRENSFTSNDVGFFEYLASIVGLASTQRRAQIALRERIKELTCLFGIAKVAARIGKSLDEMLDECAQLLPSAWLHEHEAAACIEFNGRMYPTRNFREGMCTQTADIVVKGQRIGIVTVGYPDGMPELDEGPFLREERHLIDAVARELALLVEARQTEEERLRLQEQLRHADRLATIGQLAAGVAHELNEPLAAILGLAQLAGGIPGLPDQARGDNEKIVAATLHAREIIQKLRLFARHAPSQKSHVNLNDVIRDGLDFVGPRCEKAGIALVKDLEANLPQVFADAGQLHQVLINLVVNSIQAMPNGGQITIRTVGHGQVVGLVVEDTGTGMDEKTLQNIFVPFFTTKDVDEGTGLGLSVVQGIVESHGGTIAVESKPGLGTRFEMRFPAVMPDDQGSWRKVENAE
jgi:signal transduction histidine kinase